MSYSKHEFKSGEKLYASQLNEMDEQIFKNTEETIKLSEDIADLKENGTGGGVVVSSVEPMEDDIPKVFIDGTIPTTKNDVLATLRYVSKTETFGAYIKIKCQGSSSMNYPKKNFTIKMYEDETREVSLNKVFKDWKIESNKFVLKANYIDHSHARNIVCANLWSDTVANRNDYLSLPNELKESPNNGAIDGFPIKVYTNGTYQGIYTWNIGKDAWMWKMDETNPNHVLLCGETNTNGVFAETPCNFRALWNGVNENHWSIEVGENSEELKTSLNNLISCIKDTDDETFKATISNYLDIQSAIDYYIHNYVICGLDCLGRNMLLATYDLKKWYFGAYDMDSTFGLMWDGRSFVSTEFACPEDYQEQFNLLFMRIENLFMEELKERYFSLRKTVYNYSNMFNKFERFTDLIGKDLYEEDVEIYNLIPLPNKNNIKQIREYIRERLSYVDGEITNLTGAIYCTNISLSMTSIDFTEEKPQTLTATLTPLNTTDILTWRSSDESVAIVDDNGTITPIGDGECVITATAGTATATCSITVEIGKVSIKSIAIEPSVLTIDGTAESQTLLLTTIPENATIEAVWESSNEEVATVSNGVVTPIGDGTCIISASFNDLQAICEVTVSGILAVQYGYIDLTTGVVKGSSVDVVPTRMIALPEEVSTGERVFVAYKDANVQSDSQKIAFYNQNEEFITAISNSILKVGSNIFDTVIPDGCSGLKFSSRLDGFTQFAIYKTLLIDIEQKAVEKTTGYKYETNGGVLTADTSMTAYKIPVEEDWLAIYANKVFSFGVLFDKEGNFLKNISWSASEKRVTITSNVGFIGINILTKELGTEEIYTTGEVVYKTGISLKK